MHILNGCPESEAYVALRGPIIFGGIFFQHHPSAMQTCTLKLDPNSIWTLQNTVDEMLLQMFHGIKLCELISLDSLAAARKNSA